MMARAHGNAETVEKRSHVHVVNVANKEAHHSVLALLLAKKSDSINGAHLLHAVSGKLLLVLRDVVHAQG